MENYSLIVLKLTGCWELVYVFVYAELRYFSSVYVFGLDLRPLIAEALLIQKHKPTLNTQEASVQLKLFQITQSYCNFSCFFNFVFINVFNVLESCIALY